MQDVKQQLRHALTALHAALACAVLLLMIPAHRYSTLLVPCSSLLIPVYLCLPMLDCAGSPSSPSQTPHTQTLSLTFAPTLTRHPIHSRSHSADTQWVDPSHHHCCCCSTGAAPAPECCCCCCWLLQSLHGTARSNTVPMRPNTACRNADATSNHTGEHSHVHNRSSCSAHGPFEMFSSAFSPNKSNKCCASLWL